MSQENFSAEQIAEFLYSNPNFFEDYSDIFADLKVPHPHKSQAISLGERQIMTLRDKLKNNELQLQSLVYNASGNQKINSALMQWCARMLAEPDAKQLPAHIVRSLSDQFDLDSIALRVWELPELANSEFAQDVNADTINYANSLDKPYCGPATDQIILDWLASPAQSVAIIPLHTLQSNKLIGLLVFGSEDAQRFSSDMGTDFLMLIAALTGAALSRLESHDLQSA